MNAKRTRNYYDMFAIMFNSQKSYRKYIENTHLGLLTHWRIEGGGAKGALPPPPKIG